MYDKVTVRLRGRTRENGDRADEDVCRACRQIFRTSTPLSATIRVNTDITPNFGKYLISMVTLTVGSSGDETRNIGELSEAEAPPTAQNLGVRMYGSVQPPINCPPGRLFNCLNLNILSDC